MSLKVLHLSVKKEYFFQVKSGIKLYEYRLKKCFWRKRLIDRSYDQVWIKCGYPKKDDASRIIKREWRGFEEVTIKHPHFGNEPVDVFAIRVN